MATPCWRRANGAEALQLRAEQPSEVIDLVISDVVMPEMGGRELGQRLSRLEPELPVLYMSGYTGEDVVQRGLLDPDAPFQQKPFTPEGLARKVREMLDSRGLRGPRAALNGLGDRLGVLGGSSAPRRAGRNSRCSARMDDEAARRREPGQPLARPC